MPTPLTVFAAGSLRAAFQALARSYEDDGGALVRVRFDNARALRLAIEADGGADVFASASRLDPDLLAAAGVFAAPQPFATNTVVLAVPACPSAVARVEDIGRRGVRLAVEAAGMPLGDYTRAAIGRLGDIAGPGAILHNVVTRDEDVLTVAGRVLRGEADAAFLYRSDVVASGGRLRALELPPAAQVAAMYVVAIARATSHGPAAKRWVELLLGDRGQALLRDAGFGPPGDAL